MCNPGYLRFLCIFLALFMQLTRTQHKKHHASFEEIYFLSHFAILLGFSSKKNLRLLCVLNFPYGALIKEARVVKNYRPSYAHDCQMAIAKFLPSVYVLPSGLEGHWLRYATLQFLGKEILPSGNLAYGKPPLTQFVLHLEIHRCNEREARNTEIRKQKERLRGRLHSSAISSFFPQTSSWLLKHVIRKRAKRVWPQRSICNYADCIVPLPLCAVHDGAGKKKAQSSVLALLC